MSSKPGMPQPYSMECNTSEVCRGLSEGPCPFGVRPVTDSGSLNDGGDVTPTLGVVGLAGNVAEYVRDELAPYDAPCWRAAPLLDPECKSAGVAPLRAVRGGSWAFTAAQLRAAERLGMREGENMHTPFVGFRCAYSQPPEPL